MSIFSLLEILVKKQDALLGAEAAQQHYEEVAEDVAQRIFFVESLLEARVHH